MNKKVYLGDSVYATEGVCRSIWLTTENGFPTDPSNTICLEDYVIDALLLLIKEIRKPEEEKKSPEA